MQKSIIKKVVVATAGLVLAGAVQAGEVFTVNPNALGLSPIVTPFDADTMTGTSATRITRVGATNNYTATGWIQFTSMDEPGGGGIPSGVSGIGQYYGLYATFTQTFSCPTGLGIGVTCGVTGINLTLYADPWAGNAANRNKYTDATLTGGAAVTDTLSNDIALATVDYVVAGTAGINNLGGAGENINTNFKLTANGKLYFVDPDPFYALAFSAFNNTSLGVTCGAPGTTQVNCAVGNLDTVAVNSEFGGTDFLAVPEPASLGLLGLGLLGLSAVRRRKSA